MYVLENNIKDLFINNCILPFILNNFVALYLNSTTRLMNDKD